jgi:hypothetical protein
MPCACIGACACLAAAAATALIGYYCCDEIQNCYHKRVEPMDISIDDINIIVYK